MYSCTTLLPGAKEVLTQLGILIPNSTAFFAIIPAIIRTDGLEVLVQLVTAARQILPLLRVFELDLTKISVSSEFNEFK